MSAVVDLISHFEHLSTAMNTRTSKLTRSSKSLREKGKSRMKLLVTELTDIKRPANKQKFTAETISTVSKSKTLPRDFKSTKSTTTTSEKKIYKNVANISITEEKHESVVSVSGASIKHNIVETSKQTTDIEQKVEEFGEFLKHKRQQVPQIRELNNISELSTNYSSNKTTEELEDVTDNIYCEKQEEIIDDILGLNTFDDSEDDNYVTEAYNKDGFELVIVKLEIKRHTILHNAMDDKVKELINNSDYVVHKSDYDSSRRSSTASENEIVSDEGEKYEDTSEKSNFLYNSLIQLSSPSSSEKEILYDEVAPDANAGYYYYYSNNTNNKEEEEGEEHINFYSSSNFSTCENVHIKIEDSFSETSEKKEKIDYLLVEINGTEKTYISGLKKVVEDYIPYLNANTTHDLIGRTAYLFGNIEEIYKNAIAFYDLMKENSEDADSLAQIFIDSASEFELYPLYSKNKPTADIYFKLFEEVIKERQSQLGDKLGLASFLLTPIQRLGKYVILLEEIQKELRKSNKNLEKVAAAISVIRNVMRKGNDYIAVDSIKDSPVDLTEKGSFIMRGNFTILKPRKFQSMVFLFENIIVFTEKTSKMSEYFRYYESIALSDVSLGKCEEKANTFNLTNYTKAKKAHSDATFVLQAESPKIKIDWTETIEKILWSQLKKAKEQQTNLNHRSSKHTPKISVPNGTVRKPKKYQTNAKAKSKFYDHHNS